MRIVAFTAVCGEDARYVPRFLAEAERLALPFAAYMDRWDRSAPEFAAMTRHPLCVGFREQTDPRREFDERDKQVCLDLAAAAGADWLLAWDADETFARDATEVLPRVMREEAAAGTDLVDVKWVNLWSNPGTLRTDGPFGGGHRVKLLRLGGGRSYRFYDPKVNGPRLYRNGVWASDDYVMTRRHDLVSVHWGLMTSADRASHKIRWDRIYGRHGGNPYGIWNYALDERTYPPRLEPNPYL